MRDLSIFWGDAVTVTLYSVFFNHPINCLAVTLLGLEGQLVIAYVVIPDSPPACRYAVFRQDTDEHPRFDEVFDVGWRTEDLLCGVTGVRIDNAAFAVQKVGQLISIYSGCSCNDYLSQNRDDVECGARKTGFHKQLLDEAGRLTMESLFH